MLAGGKAQRLGGKEKPLLKVGSLALIDHILKKLLPLFREIIVVTNTPHLYAGRPARVVQDEVLGQGPLRGILSGLKASASRENFVVAGDMPFINLNLVEFLKKEAPRFDVVIPEVSGKLEPLFAFYSKNCLPFIEEAIKKNFKVVSFLSLVNVKYIGEEKVKSLDPQNLSFFNINTPEDLVRAQKLYLDSRKARIEKISHR